MTNKIYQVDAFTKSLFGGNPAAVCPLDKWLSDDLLQNIALENNLSETAFYVKDGAKYHIRWFTPEVEVDLCGHATLATAYVLFNEEDHIGDTIQLYSKRSGELTVTKHGDWLTLNFPTDQLKEIVLTDALWSGFNIRPKAVLKGKTDYLFVFEDENEIKNLNPDFIEIGKLDCRGIIVTAKGSEVDFVSRFFTPQCGINEDPVTGSAHTTLTPYWAKELNKLELTAKQISAREGYLKCKLVNTRVEISGHARLYMVGKITLS
ncbi:PhzF family phenazine biosynthesis protein [Winogradskyella aurantia]|uniref:Isomerase n=1 Tax=Winogradskyella aurantia TaxID=1915063 RepID=A0A265UUU0_9FLAO|nr:PhzF family phenazine biosynthesis protein [Winogradskyella aurantia]OZV69050.1 isomerase [Winogradskyella aurantia]